MRIQPNRRVWWGALTLMLFLPASLWKPGHEARTQVHVTVRERPPLDMRGPACRAGVAAGPRAEARRDVPGASQTD
ncbi:MAG: hypothetical protein U0Q55_10340 [Vicinamibacterales bacterium]